MATMSTYDEDGRPPTSPGKINSRPSTSATSVGIRGLQTVGIAPAKLYIERGETRDFGTINVGGIDEVARVSHKDVSNKVAEYTEKLIAKHKTISDSMMLSAAEGTNTTTSHLGAITDKVAFSNSQRLEHSVRSSNRPESSSVRLPMTRPGTALLPDSSSLTRGMQSADLSFEQQRKLRTNMLSLSASQSTSRPSSANALYGSVGQQPKVTPMTHPAFATAIPRATDLPDRSYLNDVSLGALLRNNGGGRSSARITGTVADSPSLFTAPSAKGASLLTRHLSSEDQANIRSVLERATSMVGEPTPLSSQYAAWNRSQQEETSDVSSQVAAYHHHSSAHLRQMARDRLAEADPTLSVIIDNKVAPLRDQERSQLKYNDTKGGTPTRAEVRLLLNAELHNNPDRQLAYLGADNTTVDDDDIVHYNVGHADLAAANNVKAKASVTSVISENKFQGDSRAALGGIHGGQNASTGDHVARSYFANSSASNILMSHAPNFLDTTNELHRSAVHSSNPQWSATRLPSTKDSLLLFRNQQFEDWAGVALNSIDRVLVAAAARNAPNASRQRNVTTINSTISTGTGAEQPDTPFNVLASIRGEIEEESSAYLGIYSEQDGGIDGLTSNSVAVTERPAASDPNVRLQMFRHEVLRRIGVPDAIARDSLTSDPSLDPQLNVERSMVRQKYEEIRARYERQVEDSSLTTAVEAQEEEPDVCDGPLLTAAQRFTLAIMREYEAYISYLTKCHSLSAAQVAVETLHATVSELRSTTRKLDGESETLQHERNTNARLAARNDTLTKQVEDLRSYIDELRVAVALSNNALLVPQPVQPLSPARSPSSPSNSHGSDHLLAIPSASVAPPQQDVRNNHGIRSSLSVQSVGAAARHSFSSSYAGDAIAGSTINTTLLPNEPTPAPYIDAVKKFSAEIAELRVHNTKLATEGSTLARVLHSRTRELTQAQETLTSIQLQNGQLRATMKAVQQYASKLESAVKSMLWVRDEAARSALCSAMADVTVLASPMSFLDDASALATITSDAAPLMVLLQRSTAPPPANQATGTPTAPPPSRYGAAALESAQAILNSMRTDSSVMANNNSFSPQTSSYGASTQSVALTLQTTRDIVRELLTDLSNATILSKRGQSANGILGQLSAAAIDDQRQLQLSLAESKTASTTGSKIGGSKRGGQVAAQPLPQSNGVVAMKFIKTFAEKKARVSDGGQTVAMWLRCADEYRFQAAEIYLFQLIHASKIPVAAYSIIMDRMSDMKRLIGLILASATGAVGGASTSAPGGRRSSLTERPTSSGGGGAKKKAGGRTDRISRKDFLMAVTASLPNALTADDIDSLAGITLMLQQQCLIGAQAGPDTTLLKSCLAADEVCYDIFFDRVANPAPAPSPSLWGPQTAVFDTLMRLVLKAGLIHTSYLALEIGTVARDNCLATLEANADRVRSQGLTRVGQSSSASSEQLLDTDATDMRVAPFTAARLDDIVAAVWKRLARPPGLPQNTPSPGADTLQPSFSMSTSMNRPGSGAAGGAKPPLRQQGSSISYPPAVVNAAVESGSNAPSAFSDLNPESQQRKQLATTIAWIVGGIPTCYPLGLEPGNNDEDKTTFGGAEIPVSESSIFVSAEDINAAIDNILCVSNATINKGRICPMVSVKKVLANLSRNVYILPPLPESLQ